MKDLNTLNFDAIQEDFIQYIWRTKLIPKTWKGQSGENIEIIEFGHWNTDAGPDFFNAKIKIDAHIWVGNVEMHVLTSDWFRHRHEKDGAYKNVILHVVWEDDAQRTIHKSNDIPTIALKGSVPKVYLERYLSFYQRKSSIPCQSMIRDVPMEKIRISMYRMLVERLEEKARNVEKIYQQTNESWEDTLYIMMVRYFGTKVNREPFEVLARHVPLSIVMKNKGKQNTIEALFFGQAGMLEDATIEDDYYASLRKEYDFLKKKYQLSNMNPAAWKFSKMRPSNFPTVRIAQLSTVMTQVKPMFSTILQTENRKDIIALFAVSIPEYWDDHYTFGRQSKHMKKRFTDDFIDILIINAIVPILFFYGKCIQDESFSQKAMQLLEEIKAENNDIIRMFAELDIHSKNAFDTQSLLHLKNTYCHFKRCLSCTIGHEIMKGNNG